MVPWASPGVVQSSPPSRDAHELLRGATAPFLAAPMGEEGRGLSAGFAVEHWRDLFAAQQFMIHPDRDVAGNHFTDAVAQRIQQALATSREPSGALRLQLLGPGGSGKSSANALFCASGVTPLFEHDRAADHTLVMPLHFHVLLPDATSDVAITYCKYVQLTVSCLVCHRPQLAGAAATMASYWKKAVTQRTQPPLVTHAALAPSDVQVWRLLFGRLQRAYHGNSYDAFFTAMLQLPLFMRDTLGFTRLLYVMDGADALLAKTLVDWRTGQHTEVDMHTAIRRHLTLPAISFVATCVSDMQIPQCATVSMLGLIDDRTAVQQHGLPQSVRCCGRSYPISIFGGCPGFLSKLSLLATGVGMVAAGSSERSVVLFDSNVGTLLEELAALRLHESQPSLTAILS
jgi:hypothetical protein